MQTRKRRKERKLRKERKSRKERKMRKTKKGGGFFDELRKLKDKGCPEGTTRMFGAHCGLIRTPFGCCKKPL